MAIRSPSRATLIDLASQRRRFEKDLMRYVEWLMRSYKTDNQREQQLTRWLAGKMRSASEGLGVRELLADKGSLANFKRRLPVRKSIQAGDSYNWVRIVLEEAALKAREQGKLVENKGGPQVLGHRPPPGTAIGIKRDAVWGNKHYELSQQAKGLQAKVSMERGTSSPRGSSPNPQVTAAASKEMQQILARSGSNTLVLRIGYHHYTVPRNCWLDDKRLGEWLGREARHNTRLQKDLRVESKQRLTGSGKRVNPLYKIPVRIVTVVDRDPRSAMYGRSYTTRQPAPAPGKSFTDYKTGLGWVAVASAKGLKHYEKWQRARPTSVIPFGKHEGKKLDVLIGTRDERYLRVLENLRDEKIPGATRTYEQEFPGFYKAFDRRTSRLAGGAWKKGEGALMDDGMSPMDVRPYAGKSDKIRLRAILRHRWKKVPDQDTLVALLERGSISEQEFFALSGDISHVTQFEYGRNREGGFSPEDKRMNPWLLKIPLSWPWRVAGTNTYRDRQPTWWERLTGRQKAEPYTFPMIGGGTSEVGRRRSHFYQQQTSPHSMRRESERRPKVSDPDYHQSVWDDAADRTMFNVKSVPMKRSRPTPYWERHMPGTRLTSAREIATFGKSLHKVPWRVREFMNFMAQTVLTQRRKELDVAMRVEDAAKALLANREMKDLYERPRPQPTPVDILFGTTDRRTGGPTATEEVLDAQKEWGMGFQTEKPEEPEYKRASYLEQYTRAKTREELQRLDATVTEEMTLRFGGVPRMGDSPAFDALMEHRKQRWNLLALSGLRDKK